MARKPVWLSLGADIGPGYLLFVAQSSKLSHDYLTYTFKPPGVRPEYSTASGTPRPHHINYFFSPYFCVEQQEPGGTFQHTFHVPFPSQDSLIWAIVTDNCAPSGRHSFSPIKVWQYSTHDPSQPPPVWTSSTWIGFANLANLPDNQLGLLLVRRDDASPFWSSTGLEVQPLGEWQFRNNGQYPGFVKGNLLFVRKTSGPITFSLTGTLANARGLTANQPLTAISFQGNSAYYDHTVISAPGPFPQFDFDLQAITGQVAADNEASVWGVVKNTQWDTGPEQDFQRHQPYGPITFFTDIGGPTRFLTAGLSPFSDLHYAGFFHIITQPPYGQPRNVAGFAYAARIFAIGIPLIVDVTRTVLPIRRAAPF